MALRRVVGIDFHEIRTQYRASGMWRRITPNWEHLKYHLNVLGPGIYTAAELEERLFTDRSTRRGDDTKDAILGKDEERAWKQWEEEVKRFKLLRQPGPALEFTTESEMLTHVLEGVKQEQDEMYIQLQYLQPQNNVTKDRSLKRKQNYSYLKSPIDHEDHKGPRFTSSILCQGMEGDYLLTKRT